MSYSASIKLKPSYVQDWLASNFTPQDIEIELKKKGFEETAILEHIKEFKKEKNAKKQIRGFFLMGFGAFLGFLSCVLTLSQAFPQFYDAILYGLTFVGVSIVMYGMYIVFEE